MSKDRDNRKRLKRAAAAAGGGERAVVRLAPDGDHWTPEALASGVGKPVADGQGGPKIGTTERLWKRDGWIHAEITLDPEHVKRMLGDVAPAGSVSIGHNLPEGPSSPLPIGVKA